MKLQAHRTRAACRSLAAAASLCLAGCGLNDPFVGLIPYLPIAALCYAASTQDAQSRPQVTVSITNETDVTALVNLSPAIAITSGSPLCDQVFPTFVDPSGTPTSIIEPVALFVAPGETTMRSVRCGDVIAVSVVAPADPDAPPLSMLDYYGYGVGTDAGTVHVAGAGVASNLAFTGDVLVPARFVRPAVDGLDCAVQQLVLRIHAPAEADQFDPATGQVSAPGAPGSATLSIE